jgi:hypothetical protein
MASARRAPSTMLRMVPLPRLAGEELFCGSSPAGGGGGERSEPEGATAVASVA